MFDEPTTRIKLARRRGRICACAALWLLLAPRLAQCEERELLQDHGLWARSGDVLQWGIPLAGLGLTFLADDDAGSFRLDDFLGMPANAPNAALPGLNWPGPRLGRSAQQDFFVAFGRMEAMTYGLKYSIDARRPNGGDGSFPSGHTAASFMGAEFIRKQYGWWWGVPAYLAAGWVGFTRVDSQNHYWRDVAGGAAIGLLANHDLDGMQTRLGTLHFGPSMVTPSAMLQEQTDPLAPNPFDSPAARVVPGLRLEWRF